MNAFSRAPALLLKCCPACDGERTIATGDWFHDRETGAYSQVTEPCDECGGTGGVPDNEATEYAAYCADRASYDEEPLSLADWRDATANYDGPRDAP